MTDVTEPLETEQTTGVADAAEAGAAAEPVQPAEPLEPAEPIESRFLFVDVASRRANQLRRGALVRLKESEGHRVPHKLERAAMEEVRQCLIHYELPDLPESTADQG